MTRRVPVVLSIAGSDSGGGAGIQADLKAFAAAGVHGTTAITAITVQNTVGVTGVHPVPPETIQEQVRAVASDLGVDAIKIGMLGDVRTIEAVAEVLEELPANTPIVIDPVMIAESGARLLQQDAEDALAHLLIPKATFVTPNVPEAQALTGLPGGATAEELVQAVHRLGPRYALLTGGHREEATDLLCDGDDILPIQGERHPDGASHGSGCTHSSTLAAYLARGDDPLTAARKAKEVAATAVKNGLRDLGAGAGPVDVFELAKRAVDAPALP